MTRTALPITSAGRFPPRGPLGIGRLSLGIDQANEVVLANGLVMIPVAQKDADLDDVSLLAPCHVRGHGLMRRRVLSPHPACRTYSLDRERRHAPNSLAFR